ncbi:macrolide family glycosyltransferase [Pseudonocardia kunmingensis]|uniref:MGT family glycosyltransferase n=1 Tax=Pseudonocardia kunmingensis TaxID=630975 RepID=A0A543DX58_9PSEU|nr:macrolide family glycosyltransferase [Pseudonocardia kunmingensis]TQM13839.1 MGT family glycosyltransferase [Pseudonocardia kunmingensis]
MPKHLLFVALAGHGHVTPTLPLVEELVQRGHRVDYATSEEFCDAARGAGARWVPLPPLPPFVPPARVDAGMIAFWFRHYFRALRATYPVLLEHARTERPDGICYDVTNWPARLVAAELDIPAVRCIPNLAENEEYSLDAQMLAGIPPAHPEMAGLAADCADFSAEHGVDLDVAGTMDVTEAVNLVFVPREFQPHGATFDGRFHFLGPLLGRREQREPWSPPAPDRPLLYVSLGTIFTEQPEFYRTCLEAFGGGDWQVAMTVGGTDPAALGPIPPAFEVRARFPQLAVLRHASAFVTHAGMGSTMEALAHGVPLVAVPQMPEQVANADRVVELGLGERLDPAALTPDVLAEAVARVASDGRIRANVARMRRSVADGGGVVRGAEVVEEHLG